MIAKIHSDLISKKVNTKKLVKCMNSNYFTTLLSTNMTYSALPIKMYKVCKYTIMNTVNTQNYTNRTIL